MGRNQDMLDSDCLPQLVALLVEGVGRNWRGAACAAAGSSVALLVEGVGRNSNIAANLGNLWVALLVEGVGRNNDQCSRTQCTRGVALLVEGVGRNHMAKTKTVYQYESPSSWRAWVEIISTPQKAQKSSVALLVEGVGRNNKMWLGLLEPIGRPPRGGRG